MDPNRRKDFKKAPSAEDARRRRTETTIQLRKEKKEEQLQKRRGPSSSTLVKDSGTTSSQPQTAPAISNQLQQHRQDIMSKDPAVQVKSTQGFRRLLSIGMT
jgi:hypothetical protein